MNRYLVLLRGVNVGGNSKLSMAELKAELQAAGLEEVFTYINSGNVIIKSAKTAAQVKTTVEKALDDKLKLDSTQNKVLVLTKAQLQAVIDHKPTGFGENPDKYYSDALFLMDVDAQEVMPVFKPRDGVDKIWPGKGVIYSQRLGAERTKSKLNVIMTTPYYKMMTIRSWNTTTKLLAMMEKV